MIRFFRRLLCSPTWQDYYRAYHVFKQYNRASGRELYHQFFSHLSVGAFYLMMSRLEERGIVQGWYDNRSIRFEPTWSGKRRVTVRVRYYKSNIRKAAQWRML